MKFIDIGANLLDDRFLHGIYRGKFRHAPDLPHVMERASATCIDKLILTAGTLEESRKAVQMARQWRNEFPQIDFRCTVGVHPTRCQQEFEDANDMTPDQVIQELLEIVKDGMQDHTVVAIGEIGLDYDRLEFSSADIQQKYLKLQLEALEHQGLPLFLHNRSVGTDLLDILRGLSTTRHKGVVHSFDDSLELAQQFIELGFDIGLNGCSLRTEENLQVVRELPLTSIQLETDCPYCEVRSTHAGYSWVQTKFEAKAEKKYEEGFCVKNRQEPCHVIQIAEIIAGVKNIPLEEVTEQCYQNSMRVFF